MSKKNDIFTSISETRLWQSFQFDLHSIEYSAGLMMIGKVFQICV